MAASGGGSPLVFLLFGQLAGREDGGVGHVYAEEQHQCLAHLVACCDAAQAVVLLVVAEAALHHGGPEVADDAPCLGDSLVLVLGFGAFVDVCRAKLM